MNNSIIFEIVILFKYDFINFFVKVMFWIIQFTHKKPEQNLAAF